MSFHDTVELIHICLLRFSDRDSASFLVHSWYTAVKL